MTNTKLLELRAALLGLKDLKGVKFNYCISKNLALLDTEVKSFNDSIKISDEFKKYDSERVELCKKHAKLDSNDQPIITVDPLTKEEKYSILDQKAFDTELADLNNINKEAIDTRVKQIEDFNDFLTKESTIILFKMKLEDVSPDITTEQMVGIYPLIEE